MTDPIIPSPPSGVRDAELRLGAAVAEAAASVVGVHRLGGTAARTLDRASRAVLGTTTGPGVTVSTEAGATTVDLDIVVEYRHAVRTVIEAARTRVRETAEALGAADVVVDVTVTDVHGPFDTETPDPGASS